VHENGEDDNDDLEARAPRTATPDAPPTLPPLQIPSLSDSDIHGGMYYSHWAIIIVTHFFFPFVADFCRLFC
jgi:hypothetical protein